MNDGFFEVFKGREKRFLSCSKFDKKWRKKGQKKG
jgi:hypothetical protein